MKYLLICLLFVGCARTYHVYNIADNGSTITQELTVAADVVKPVDVTTDADVQAFDEVENPDKNDSVEMLYVIHHDHNWGE